MTGQGSEAEQVPFIWVVSYPKSGNTWMRTMLREYIKRVFGERPFECNDVSQYWYQTVSPRPLDTMGPLEICQLRPAAMMHLTTMQRYRQKPRPAAIVKSHFLSGDFFGIPFFCPLWVDSAIYIHRDPRDVLPSFADHMGDTLEEAAETMANQKATLGKPKHHKLASPMGSWSMHVMSWLEQKRVPTIYTSYERMHENTTRELRRVVEHAGLPVHENNLKEAVEAARFEKLQKKEEQEGFKEASEHQERFFRRGIVGSHKDEVPEKFIKKIEEDHGRLMKMLGYG